MPDPSDQREMVNDFARNMPDLVVTSEKKGGVLLARNGKSYIVNVRPSKWNDKHKPSQFWKGKVKEWKWAQYYADAVFHYCGKPRFHFKNEEVNFPPLECIGKFGTPERLTTTEQCSKFVQSIAGEGFDLQRADFLQKVKDVIESDGFVLQGGSFLSRGANGRQNPVIVVGETAAVSAEEFAALPSAPLPREKPAALPSSSLPGAALVREEAAALTSACLPREEAAASPAVEVARIDDNEELADREPPMEEDDVTLQLRANLASGFASSRATVAGFELNQDKLDGDVSKRSIHSVEESLGPRYYNLCDCPAGIDEGWNISIQELNKRSAFNGGILNSAAGALIAAVESTSNAVEVYQKPGFENVSSIVVFEGVSFLPGTKFVHLESLSDDFDSAAVLMTAEAEQLKNAKRPRIGN